MCDPHLVPHLVIDPLHFWLPGVILVHMGHQGSSAYYNYTT